MSFFVSFFRRFLYTLQNYFFWRFWGLSARPVSIFVIFGSPNGFLEGRFSGFFGGFPVEQADSLEEEATSVKPTKTLVFTGFSHIRACAHASKIDRKSWRTRFSSESRDGSPSKVDFFELGNLKMGPRGLSGASLSALERLLGRSWALLGRSLALLRSSWDLLGALLGRSLAALGRSWALLEPPWAILA